MAPPPGKLPLSPPLAARELNGEQLLEELYELREGQVRTAQLAACARDLRAQRDSDPARLKKQLVALAEGRYAPQPALAQLLRSWAPRVNVPGDVAALTSHFERLALTSALLTALHYGRARLPGGGGRG